jgi:WD40 repeat protein
MAIKQNELAQFYGTTKWHRFSQLFPNLLLTDGAKYIAENGGQEGAYWLMDAIGSYQPQLLKTPTLRDFQLWTIAVNPDKTAKLTCRADSDLEPEVEQLIEHTDLDVKELSMYCMPLGDGKSYTILLQSEY